ncbi:MAG: hypothetical protein C0615_09485 [Desulfuromonas sp.]|nr:MAG: hypothetical protein C0615_09485 [Desulfuromonas sp.]
MSIHRLFLFLPILILVITLVAGPAFAGIHERDKIDQVISTLDAAVVIPEKGIPRELLGEAAAIAIIPNVVKAGFIIAGRFGRGVILARNDEGAWGHPIFITISGGSLGFQFGAQSSDVILVFKKRKGVDKIVRGRMTLGADAAVAAGPVGRQAETSTDKSFRASVLSYSRSRGLFAGVSLVGSVLSVDEEWNHSFYEREVSSEELFTGSGGLPAEAVTLKEKIRTYTEKK